MKIRGVNFETPFFSIIFFRPTDPEELKQNPCFEKLNWSGLTKEHEVMSYCIASLLKNLFKICTSSSHRTIAKQSTVLKPCPSYRPYRSFLNFKLPLTTTTADSICTVLASIWGFIFNGNVVLHY